MRILGVPVGKVETVTPSGTDVVVTMSYDAEFDVPADADAVIISPAIVGDRFVQLTPVYNGGDVLADGATLDSDRTAVPLELDQIYQSIDDLTVALGPEGANEKGALTDLLDTTAANFGGQGAQVPPDHRGPRPAHRHARRQQGRAVRRRRGARGFINTLAENDQTVRHFNQSLAVGRRRCSRASATSSRRRCATWASP